MIYKWDGVVAGALNAATEVPNRAKNEIGTEDDGSKLAIKRHKALIWSIEKLRLSTEGAGE